LEEEFTQVINESELAEGTMKGVKIKEIPILLIKKDRKIYAYDDRCPHQQCLISRGAITDAVVICPCHDWKFKIKTGKYTDEPVLGLTSFDVKVQDGKIWVKIEETFV